MKMIAMVAVFVLLLCEAALPGVLYGRIIKEDGRALARTRIAVETDTVTTNGFGGYEVRLADSTRTLTFRIMESDTVWNAYTTDPIRIYSPKTKQNWRMSRDRQSGDLRLIKVK
jgi:hypothetical protein